MVIITHEVVKYSIAETPLPRWLQESDGLRQWLQARRDAESDAEPKASDPRIPPPTAGYVMECQREAMAYLTKEMLGHTCDPPGLFPMGGEEYQNARDRSTDAGMMS